MTRSIDGHDVSVITGDAGAIDSGAPTGGPLVAPAAERGGPVAATASVAARTIGWMGRHPLLVVAAVTGMVAIAQGWWIWTHRVPGAIDPDEAGYIADALRLRRLLVQDPFALPRAIGGTGTGPAVPLVTVPLLLVGPRDPRTALLAQPLLMVLASVSVAGITRRLAGPAAAIIAGVAFATLPTVIFASQTYWLGLGAATALAGATWALLASDRLTTRLVWLSGLLVGVMLLSRTMALAYVPGFGLAAVVLAGRDRRSWIGLAKVAGTAVVVAGPWWFAARSSIFGYLFSYGYGERADRFGDARLADRVLKRFSTLSDGIGTPLVPLVVVAVIGAALVLWRRESFGERGREAAALAVASAVGFAALASSSNNGVWFELPLITLLTPLLIAAAARSWLPLRILVAVLWIAASVLQLACALWFIAPGPSLPLVLDRNRSSQFEPGFAEYDPRFAPDRRGQAAGAAAEWWAFNRRVAEDLRSISGGDVVVTMSGNFQLFNSNSVRLAGEDAGWTPRIRVPDTVRPSSVRAELTPLARPSSGSAREVERVVVIARHDQILFTPDERVEAFRSQALADGWEVVGVRAIPGGGTAELLRHPDGSG